MSGASASASRPVLVLAGPTASGKSAAALALGDRLPIEVINADASQVYRGLASLSAQPDATAQTRLRHHLYGIRDPQAPASAAWWRDTALEAIQVVPPSRLPVLVGGTGLYLRALMAGLNDLPAVPPEVRDRVTARRATIGPTAFHAELTAIDPIAAARIRSSDSQRMIRARELFEATGQTMTALLDAPRSGPPDYLRFVTVRLDPPRDVLCARIDGRFPELIKAGAMEEVRALIDLPPSLPAAKALGFPELRAHLTGETDLASAIIAASTATRRYAKRQATWFRHQFAADLTIGAQHYDEIAYLIFAFIRDRGLTPTG